MTSARTTRETMAILFYLLFRAGFISPTTPAAETNTYGFAAIAGLVGLFSDRASRMLENAANIIFSRADAGPETVSPGEFSLTPSHSLQRVAPGETAKYGLTVTPTQDFSGPVALTSAVTPSLEKGPSVTLDPTTLTPTPNDTLVTLTAATAADTPPNDYMIIVTATGGGTMKQVAVTLRVEPPPGASAMP